MEQKPKIPLLMRPGLWLAVAAVAAMAAFAAWRAMPRVPEFHATTYEPAPAADFRLTGHDGRPVSLASFRGRPVLLFFGFTHCPDVCPLTLNRLSRVIKELGERAEDVRVLLVTVDPERDTPQALKAYVERFGPFVTGLTGTAEELEKARQGYGAYVVRRDTAAVPAGHGAHGGHGAAPKTGIPDTVHSTAVYGIDRDGNLRFVFTDLPEEQVRDDVRTLAGI